MPVAPPVPAQTPAASLLASVNATTTREKSPIRRLLVRSYGPYWCIQRYASGPTVPFRRYSHIHDPLFECHVAFVPFLQEERTMSI
ncbi:uncharacterized protein ASPGLDRAFT_49398 [Aspergillus glaucus CBS 516.65]|uniref:Uncharacterized protein n=1 Tax=Aspergillus glaucus CBS 516.65 TaxID=1160497 RepID=A0A1L9VDL8_ASPGL|nr:hypothetical protein ASPGLDRAFT_49398 [Aspergillus glaucus CBS 516.65]OJJ82014.1 hypothetical protein ASPGLDRAFT_49398 [Aspergillus glaucus CBS 516.65]